MVHPARSHGIDPTSCQACCSPCSCSGSRSSTCDEKERLNRAPLLAYAQLPLCCERNVPRPPPAAVHRVMSLKSFGEQERVCATLAICIKRPNTDFETGFTHGISHLSVERRSHARSCRSNTVVRPSGYGYCSGRKPASCKGHVCFANMT